MVTVLAITVVTGLGSPGDGKYQRDGNSLREGGCPGDCPRDSKYPSNDGGCRLDRLYRAF